MLLLTCRLHQLLDLWTEKRKSGMRTILLFCCTILLPPTISTLCFIIHGGLFCAFYMYGFAIFCFSVALLVVNDRLVLPRYCRPLRRTENSSCSMYYVHMYMIMIVRATITISYLKVKYALQNLFTHEKARYSVHLFRQHQIYNQLLILIVIVQVQVQVNYIRSTNS
jgi:hypothetical protein